MDGSSPQGARFDRSADPVRPVRVEVIPPPHLRFAGRPPEGRPLLAGLLLALTFFSTTTLGATWYLLTRRGAVTDLLPWLTPSAIGSVWSDPELLRVGLGFSLPLLAILLAHELGHYLAARAYRLPVTLPYFIPAPVGLGTFGAFIRIRTQMRSKRELFDVGVAGPLAGFVVLVPFLLLGIAWSEPVSLGQPPGADEPATLLFVPGANLATELTTLLFHGPMPDGTILDLHPFALAAWVGLLATALNLLPLGQLDGGHILYAVTGRLQRRLALPLWAGLGLIGLYWPGWLLWCLAFLILGLYHPPVLDERRPLDRGRLALAAVALVLLALSFMPVPIDLVPVTGP